MQTSYHPTFVAPDLTLDRAFEDAVRAAPERKAVADKTTTLSYAELASASRAVAQALGEHGIGAGCTVAVRLTPRTELLAVILGILSAGAAYLPLDSSGGTARDTFVLEDARPAAIIEGRDVPELPTRGGRGIALTASSQLRMLNADRQRPRLPTGTAYVIYTSGTTGRPKGTPITHRNVLALFAATDQLFDFTSSDCWLLYHSIAFDFSVWEMWGALLYGGRLFVPDRSTIRDPDEVGAVIRRERVTVLNQTPTAFGVLGPVLSTAPDEHALRYVVFGGERLRPSNLAPWVHAHGLHRPVLVNMYGTTETTVHATFHRVTEADLESDTSPIGRALPGFTARVVYADGEASGGELLLAGPQVSDGYLDRLELTAARFVRSGEQTFYRTGDLVRDPAARGARDRAPGDGGNELCYLGRNDDQVKVRGHRVELGEVEQAVLGAPGITGAIVTTFPVAGDESLVCAYTSVDGGPVPLAALRRDLRAAVPEYMVPTRYVWVEELPLTANGKADRRRVRELAVAEVEAGRRASPPDTE